MRDTDQAVRAKVTARLGELGASDPDLSVVLLAAEQSSIDRRNTTRLKEIVATVGWPTAELVGAEASQAAWLLAQHADHDIEFQEHVLELVRPLVGSEGVRPADLALLTDRVRVGRGEPQLYGSQWLVEKVEGVRQLAPATPIEDPQRVDERRAAAELPSLAVYLGLLREAYGLPEDAPTRPE